MRRYSRYGVFMKSFNFALVLAAAGCLMMGCASTSNSTAADTTNTAAEVVDPAQEAAAATAAMIQADKSIDPACKKTIVQMVTKQNGAHHYLLDDASLWEINDSGEARMIKKLPDAADTYKLIPSDDVIIHYTGDKIMLTHIETNTELFRLAGDASMKTVMFTPNNLEMATRDSGNVFNVWNVPKRFSGIQISETVQDFINRQSPDRKLKFSVDAYAVSLTNEGRAILASDDAANNKIGLIYFMDDKNAKGTLKATGRANAHITHLAIALSGNNVAAVDENGKLYVSSTGEDKGFKVYARNYTNMKNVKFVGEDVLAIENDKLTRIDIASGMVKWSMPDVVKTCYAPSSDRILCVTDDVVHEIDGNTGKIDRIVFFNSDKFGYIHDGKLYGTADQTCFK